MMSYCDIDYGLFREYKKWNSKKRFALKHGQADRVQAAEKELVTIRAHFAELYALRRAKKFGDKQVESK